MMLYKTRNKTNKINILFLDHFSSISGGQRSLLTHIDFLDNKKFNIYVGVSYTVGELHYKLNNRNVTTFKCLNESMHSRHKKYTYLLNPANYITSFLSILKIIKIVKQNNIDIIHGNTKKASLLGSIVGKICRVYSLYHARLSRSYSNHGIIDHIICYLSNYIIVNSNFTLNSFTHWTHKCRILYSPVSVNIEGLNLYNKYKNSSKLLPNDQQFTIGMIGRLIPQKRPLDALVTFDLVKKHIKNSNLIFVGDESPQYLGYTKCIKDNELYIKHNNSISFEGYKDNIFEILSSINVLLFPSINEPMGRVVLEAALAKVPVIAYRSGGVPELVIENHTAILVEPYDTYSMAQSIINLARCPKRSKEIGINAQNFVLSHFSPTSINNKLQNIYFALYYNHKV